MGSATTGLYSGGLFRPGDHTVGVVVPDQQRRVDPEGSAVLTTLLRGNTPLLNSAILPARAYPGQFEPVRRAAGVARPVRRDRKSGAEGKRVSGRVEKGGR